MVRASAKSVMSFIDFDICQRMVPVADDHFNLHFQRQTFSSYAFAITIVQ